MSRFAHVVEHWTPNAARLKATCGAYVSASNLPAIYSERMPAYQRPICPKCAAAKLLAELVAASPVAR
jgi:hypothetical protein